MTRKAILGFLMSSRPRCSSKNKPEARSSQANETFSRHFRKYAVDAGRQSLLDAAETETDPHELVQFAEARFHSLIHDFEASFFDCWRVIRRPFQEAAKNSIHTGPRP